MELNEAIEILSKQGKDIAIDTRGQRHEKFGDSVIVTNFQDLLSLDFDEYYDGLHIRIGSIRRKTPDYLTWNSIGLFDKIYGKTLKEALIIMAENKIKVDVMEALK